MLQHIECLRNFFGVQFTDKLPLFPSATGEFVAKSLMVDTIAAACAAANKNCCPASSSASSSAATSLCSMHVQYVLVGIPSPGTR